MDFDTFVIDCLGDKKLLSLYMASNAERKSGDAGVDLFCTEDCSVPAHSLGYTLNFKVICRRICSPGGVDGSYYLYPRSSISKTPLRLANSVGIIDAGYRGHIMAKVDNMSDTEFVIKRGDRLFQICMPDLRTPTVVFDNVSTDTERGSGGFGSTGR